MTEPEIEELVPVEPGYMDEEETFIADEIYAAIMDYSLNSKRGLQAQAFKVGVSDLGYCSERLRRMLDQQVPEDVDFLKAFIGTWLGEGVETAYKKAHPNIITQCEVTLPLKGDGGDYFLKGHPDIVDPDRKLVLDGKSAPGLSAVRRSGPDRQKQFQRHGYGYACWLAGMFGECDLEEVRVGNVWIDRSGVEQGLHVQIEPLNMEFIEEMTAWLDDVVYAFKNEEEARKEPAREMCAVTCGFFRTCRAYDTDASGLISDPQLLEIVKMQREGHALETRGKAMKKEAKGLLQGVEGSTGEFVLRWVHVNATEIPSYTRAAYDKIDIRPVPKGRAKKSVVTEAMVVDEPVQGSGLHEALRDKGGFDSDGNME